MTTNYFNQLFLCNAVSVRYFTHKDVRTGTPTISACVEARGRGKFTFPHCRTIKNLVPNGQLGGEKDGLSNKRKRAPLAAVAVVAIRKKAVTFPKLPH